jgi:hypothetical protein
MWDWSNCGKTNWEDAEQCSRCEFTRAGQAPKPTKLGHFIGPDRDVFISHASEDKQEYIQPISEALRQREVSFWLDELEIGWGDSIVLAINEGLAKSKIVLLCLSKCFLWKRWPEAEMSAALALQLRSAPTRVLPLLLDSAERILERYPLLGALSYRDYSGGPWRIADEIAKLLDRPTKSDGKFRLVVESVHRPNVHAIAADPRASVQWLIDEFIAVTGVLTRVDIGTYTKAEFCWVLVDVRAEETWRQLSREEQRRVKAVVASETGARIACEGSERLAELGVTDGTTFHFYAVPARDPPPPMYSLRRRT